MHPGMAEGYHLWSKRWTGKCCPITWPVSYQTQSVLKSNTFCPPASPNSISTQIQHILSTCFSKLNLVLKSNTFCPPASPNSISIRIQTHFVHLLVQRRHSTRVLCGFSLFVFDGIPAIEYSSMYVGLAWTICLVISLARVPYTHWFGQNMAAIHNVYTVFLAGKLPNIRSYTVYIHMVLANPTSVHWCRHVCGKGVRLSRVWERDAHWCCHVCGKGVRFDVVTCVGRECALMLSRVWEGGARWCCHVCGKGVRFDVVTCMGRGCAVKKKL